MNGSVPNTVGFKGRGPVRFAPYAKPDNLQRLGNNNSLELAYETSDEQLQDFEGEAGGVAETDSEITNVTMGLNLLQQSAQNQALGNRGTVRKQGNATVTDEAHHGYPGALVALVSTPDGGQAVTVAENGGTWQATTAVVAATDTLHATWVTKTGRIYECTTAGTTGPTEPSWPTNEGDTVIDGTAEWTDRGDVSTLAKDTDWSVSHGAGITIPATGSKIKWGMPIKVSYTPANDVMLIDALKNAAGEYRLVFDGMNRLRDNRPCTIIVWRAKPAPGGINYISESFGEMPLTFTVLKDDSISPDGPTSQYFQIRWKDAA